MACKLDRLEADGTAWVPGAAHTGVRGAGRDRSAVESTWLRSFRSNGCYHGRYGAPSLVAALVFGLGQLLRLRFPYCERRPSLETAEAVGNPQWWHTRADKPKPR